MDCTNWGLSNGDPTFFPQGCRFQDARPWGKSIMFTPVFPRVGDPLFHPQSHPISELILTWIENVSTTPASLPGGICNASCCFGHRIISIKDEPILTPTEGPVCCFSGWASCEWTDCREPAITIEIVFSGSVHFVTCCPTGSFHKLAAT